MAWGMSNKGYERPNQAEIREALDARTREEFGADVNLSDKSPNGIINGIMSWFFAKLWELGEKVYHSSQPSQADGVQLDYLTPFYGTSRRRPQYAMVTLTLTGTVGYTVPFGRLFKTVDGIQFISLQSLTFGSTGTGTLLATAVLPGVAGNVITGSITEQVEPDSDITSVTNLAGAEGGSEEESDNDLRARLERSFAALGSGTINAIYADLLEVPGVRAVRIKVNELSTIVDGLPPHSIAVYTYGGDNEAVAKSLMKNYTGIQFYGNVTVPVDDISGHSHDISFSKAVAVEMAVNVNVTTDNTFSPNGDVAIKNAIVKVIGGLDSNGNALNGYNMGDDVIYAQLLAAVMSVQGVTNVDLTVGKQGGALAKDDVVIDDMEVANILLSNITVVTS